MGALDGAIASGLDCTFDIYPYPTGSSFPAAYLPSWAQEGGPDAILEHLRDPSERARIAAYLDGEYGSRGGIALERFVFSYLPRQPEREGAALRLARASGAGALAKVHQIDPEGRAAGAGGHHALHHAERLGQSHLRGRLDLPGQHQCRGPDRQACGHRQGDAHGRP